MTNIENYNHKLVEKKWQKYWNKNKTFKFEEKSEKEKFYMLEMFPYPSGELHAGHLRNFAIGDVIARYKRMKGYNVLHPMGADAFGLPAENAAHKNGVNPAEWTKGNLNRFLDGMKKVGLSYDYDRVFATCDEDYYGFQQKIFLDFYEKGLAYKKESFVNWDPVDNTVLANEQVVDGKGWRSGAVVEKKKLNQWFFKITKYADELLDGLKELKGWSDKVKLMQENWIGKSYGCMIDFEINNKDEKIKVYTTRPDTLFGASFIGISANHPIAEELAKNNPEAEQFIEKCSKTAVDEASMEKMEKLGFKTEIEAKHPFDEEWKLPVYICNFVLMEYGTGAIFACPAHDERDFEFAKKYGLQIREVVSPLDKRERGETSEGFLESEKPQQTPQLTSLATPLVRGAKPLSGGQLPFTESGIAINSSFLNGLTTPEAKERMIQELETTGKGSRKTNYRLRDWGISRQRYWGCPIPMINCPHCGSVPEKAEKLPVKLPQDVSFDKPGNPLDFHPTWKDTTCPKCGSHATRETDTMDTFVDSSWYFMRFVDLDKNSPINSDLCNRVLSVDQYVGGIEHATMHLIYSRFFVKAMRDCGYLDKSISEVSKKLFNQGMVCHKAYRDSHKEWVYPWDVKEENGKYFNVHNNEELSFEGIIKMSKSKKNVVDILNVVDTYGSDSARMFVLSDSPADKDFEWTEQGIEGCWKYINKIWKMVKNFSNIYNLNDLSKDSLENNSIVVETHKTIKFVTEFLENMEFNKAIAKIRELSNFLEKEDFNVKENASSLYFAISALIKLFSPFAPHFAEEMNEILCCEKKLDIAQWPKYNEKFLATDSVNIAIQVNGKLRATMKVNKNISKEELEILAKSDKSVERHIEGKDIKKIIVVPGKLVSIVC